MVAVRQMAHHVTVKILRARDCSLSTSVGRTRMAKGDRVPPDGDHDGTRTQSGLQGDSTTSADAGPSRLTGRWRPRARIRKRHVVNGTKWRTTCSGLSGLIRRSRIRTVSDIDQRQPRWRESFTVP